ncbi:MAG: hypothetical protein KDB27_33425 [Planctomycetales bacterium]|nr:hypothetical protein [Planctomycetales bacterium]
MSRGNDLAESRVTIECGGVWLEVFEQSEKPERRVTKATLTALEQEFALFVQDPAAALATARMRARELASRLAGGENCPFRLLTGMQPGIYQVAYLLNPGESGSVYLKAFEVTNETPLSVSRLEETSKTRMTWSPDPTERFASRAGFTIYEGDWGVNPMPLASKCGSSPILTIRIGSLQNASSKSKAGSDERADETASLHTERSDWTSGA